MKSNKQPQWQVKRNESIWAIVMNVLLLALLLTFVGRFRVPFGGACTQVFDAQRVYALWYFFALLCLLNIARETVKLALGHYGIGVLVVNLLCGVCSLCILYWLLMRCGVVQPAFLAGLAEAAKGIPFVGWVAQRPREAVLFLGAFGTLIDLVDNIVRAVAYSAHVSEARCAGA